MGRIIQSFLILFFPLNFLISQTWISSVSPPQNKVGARQDEIIKIVFNRDLLPASIVEPSVVVVGLQTGKYLPLSVKYDSGFRTITFAPAKKFKIGEKIQVTVTRKIQDISGISMPVGFVWNFFVGSIPNYPNFTEGFIEDGHSSSSEIAVADFNKDGFLDAAIPDGDYTGSVGIFNGLGNGTFSSVKLAPVGIWPYWVDAADFDNDGDIDLVVNTDSLCIVKNDGTGKFALGKRMKVASTSFEVGDLNGDGVMDIFVCNGYTDSSCTVLLNDGNGAFPQKKVTSPAFGTWSAALGDFDNNGTLDAMVVSDTQYPAQIGFQTKFTFYNNDGFGNMTKVYEIYHKGGQAGESASGDLDGDGFIDYAVSCSDTTGIRVILNNRNNTFSEKGNLRALYEAESVHLADLDGDGKLDVISTDQCTSSGALSLFMNDGNANFSRTRIRTTYGPLRVKTGDVDGDGDVDIVVSSICFCGPFLTVLRNDGFTPVRVVVKALPMISHLEQNYPNPFNPVTVISYQLPVNGGVTIAVYDILGREVATLVNEQKSAGVYSAQFDASKLSSGIYFYRLKAWDHTETKRMMLVK